MVLMSPNSEKRFLFSSPSSPIGLRDRLVHSYGGRVLRLLSLRRFPFGCFSNHPQRFLLLLEREWVAVGQSDDPLPTPADGEAQELARDRIHAAVGLAMKNNPHRTHEWIAVTYRVFVTGQDVAAVRCLKRNETRPRSSPHHTGKTDACIVRAHSLDQ